jgi:hypothetical protein
MLQTLVKRLFISLQLFLLIASGCSSKYASALSTKVVLCYFLLYNVFSILYSVHNKTDLSSAHWLAVCTGF